MHHPLFSLLLLSLLCLLLLPNPVSSQIYYNLTSTPVISICALPAVTCLLTPNPYGSSVSASCCPSTISGGGYYCGYGCNVCGCNDTTCMTCAPGDHCIQTTFCATETGYILLFVLSIIAFLLLLCCCGGLIYCCCCGCPEICACLLCTWCCCELSGMM